MATPSFAVCITSTAAMNTSRRSWRPLAPISSELRSRACRSYRAAQFARRIVSVSLLRVEAGRCRHWLQVRAENARAGRVAVVWTLFGSLRVCSAGRSDGGIQDEVGLHPRERLWTNPSYAQQVSSALETLEFGSQLKDGFRPLRSDSWETSQRVSACKVQDDATIFRERRAVLGRCLHVGRGSTVG